MGRKKVFCPECNDGVTLYRKCGKHNPKIKEAKERWKENHPEEYLEKKRAYNQVYLSKPGKREELNRKYREKYQQKKFEAIIIEAPLIAAN